MLPREYPNPKSVYHYFRVWRADGTWRRIHDRLRGDLRESCGRRRQPSAAILDTQSVKTTDVGGPERGYDGGKKVVGRKRHLLVDTMGLVLVAVVHAASTQDWIGARQVLSSVKHRYHKLRQIWADSVHGNGGLPGWTWDLRPQGELLLEVANRQRGQIGFSVLPRRWVIERTFGGLVRHRRLVRDYEYLPATSEAMIYLAMIRVMLKRLENRA